MGKIIGIDLGTTNSLVSVWEKGKSILIPNATGGFLTPSVVSIEKDGTVYVGDVAVERRVTNPENTVSVFKRFMGTSKLYHLAGKDYYPEELSAIVLRKLKEDAEKYLQEEIEEAVISVPAYFNDDGRSATKRAGELAGLKVERIVNEPSAAALAYQHMNDLEDATLLVFDFGGGTLDVSLVDCFDNIVEILAVCGDNRLGGSDFDQVIYDEFLLQNKLDEGQLSEEEKAILLMRATKCKLALSKQESSTMYMDIDGHEYSLELNQEYFIRITQKLLARLIQPVKKVLLDGNVSKERLTGIVLVGGSCKMPIIRDFLEYSLQTNQISIIEPDHMIALGVGVYAGIKERSEDVKDMMLTDICPFSLGVGVRNPSNEKKQNMLVIIERNTALPASREYVVSAIEKGQMRMLLKVYQGESHDVDDNCEIGSLEIKLPKNDEEREKVAVRFTYDINGLLYVEAKIISTGKVQTLVIQNGKKQMSIQEIEKQVKQLESLRIHPREKEENKMLLERAARLFSETTGDWRTELAYRIRFFQEYLNTQDEYRIHKLKKHFTAFLDYVEEQIDTHTLAVEDANGFCNWYKNKAENEEDHMENEQEEQEYQVWNLSSNGYTS